MKCGSLLYAVVVIVGVIHFSTETSSAVVSQGREGRSELEESEAETSMRKSEGEPAEEGEEEGRSGDVEVEERSAQEGDDDAEEADGAEADSNAVEARQEPRDGNGRAIITGTRVAVGLARKVFGRNQS